MCDIMTCVDETLLSGCGGGNGVYGFLMRFFIGCRRLLMFFDLNFGRNRSHDSFFSTGSFSSSLFIISICCNIHISLHIPAAVHSSISSHLIHTELITSTEHSEANISTAILSTLINIHCVVCVHEAGHCRLCSCFYVICHYNFVGKTLASKCQFTTATDMSTMQFMYQC